MFNSEAEAIAYLRSPRAIRDRSQQLFDLAVQGRLHHFGCDLNQLEATATYVLSVIQTAYPDLNVPFHSRWRHFNGGGISRLTRLHKALAPLTPLEQTRAKVDLAVVSVLLDAGAGADWQYQEPETGLIWKRSEGLAIASFHLFCQGLFSSDATQPLQVDAAGLQQLTLDVLGQGFQVGPDNPLVGLEGRLNLMHQLGAALSRQPQLFGSAPPRPGHLVDYWVEQATNQQVSANQVLQAVLTGLGDIWAGRVAIAGVNLGDVWPHSALTGEQPWDALVPFHKLSQWLTYSLLEPLQDLGLTIIGLDELTGLAEYRNGGLCLDLGLLYPKSTDLTQSSHRPDSEVIVEWRALTVILLDHIADAIRQRLNLDALSLPLVKVLEGGTWAAGRKIALEKRPGGIPPLQIESDGTVF